MVSPIRKLAFVLLLVSFSAPADFREYDARFVARFDPDAGVAHATIAITPGEGRPKEFNFAMPASRYKAVQGEGKVERTGDRVVWTVPRAGGTLRYDVVVDHQRSNGSFDARMTERWAIVRGDALFPPAKVRTTKDSEASSRLVIELPPGWTDRESGYLLGRGGQFVVVNSGQRFDRPVGWIAAGDLTTQSEKIDSVDYRVSAPKGAGLDRIAILAMLRAATPHARVAFGELPDKILVVGGDDPMWRGGLSGPRSVWMHADRKLQSENGTSPLLHELTHTVTGLHAARGDDWIVEGLAEYYSIELARRANLLSDKLALRGIKLLRKRGAPVASLAAPASRGALTARAAALFADLDTEIRERSDDAHSLDDVVQALMRERLVSRADLDKAVSALIGASKVLAKT
jgi:hypothetical protein